MKYGLGSINEYFGVKGSPKNTNTNTGVGDYQIIPHLAYYDIFKNYYANKQEARFYVMGGSLIQNATTIKSTDFEGTMIGKNNNLLKCTKECTVTITGTDLNLKNIKKILFKIDTNPIYIDVTPLWETVSEKTNEIVIRTKVGQPYVTSRTIIGDKDQSFTLNGATSIS